MYQRLSKLSKSNSFFLLGPRGVGKSTLISTLFGKENTLWIDLLDPDEEERLSINPGSFIERWSEMEKKAEWIIIDEIQKIPKILDVVHMAIEKYKIKFVLTGSSARKLKRGGANLLAGRAFMFHLHPFSESELKENFSLPDALRFGLLPKALEYSSELDKKRFLKSYCQTYIKEEIQVEQLLRKIPPFRKFLGIAAQANGEIINFSKLARQTGVDHKTVANYFQILEETMMGFFLESYSGSFRKKQISSPKFYWFDTGIVNTLAGIDPTQISANTFHYGKLFEHFILLELIKLNEYYETDYQFTYLKTHDGLEIDLIIERPGKPNVLIEIKSSQSYDKDDIKHLKNIREHFKDSIQILLYCGKTSTKLDDVSILPWKEGVQRVFHLPY